MKVKKGEYGYIRYERKKRLLITAVMLAVPLAIFIAGLLITDGNRNNIFTVAAVVGCLPGCKSIVGVVMMFLQKPMDEAVYKEIQNHVGTLTMVYETCITKEEGSLLLYAAAICGEEIAAFTSTAKDQHQIEACEKYLSKMIRANGYRCHVKIFDRKKAFLERLDSLNSNSESLCAAANERFKPDERYPDLSREELVKHNVLALSL